MEELVKKRLNVEHRGCTCKKPHLAYLTDESTGEDLVVGGAQLPPEVVGGDSTRSSCFLSIVHLSNKDNLHSQDNNLFSDYI